MLEVTVEGRASKKTIRKFSVSKDSDVSFLKILRAENIMIASSCFGEGVCKRCIVNDDKLSCKFSPKDISQNQLVIYVDYL